MATKPKVDKSNWTLAQWSAYVKEKETKLHAQPHHKLVAKLEQTHNNLRAYAGANRGPGTSRFMDLSDRFDNLRTALRATSAGQDAHNKFCERIGIHTDAEPFDYLA